ncbi:MAG: phosphate acyltransferase PlsX [Lachnospiraceae bacterium]|nr:phosphate acyltransferase PlsX [Lachnospiraceae bacterium]
MEKIRVALDAMGGDLAPQAPVAGAVAAVKENSGVKVFLLGNEAAVKDELSRLGYTGDAIEVVPCTETIEMAEPPVAAISKKKDSSIVRGMNMVRHGEADCFVSAGSTGAILVGGQVIVGRVKGVQRPPLGSLIPTEKGFSLLIDCGANMDARPQWLLQFAEMGSIYYENFMGVKKPRVAILNVGAEEEKGNALVKETFPLLKASENINFVGSVEARDITSGGADIIVCDAFSGNMILKMYEGTAATFLRVIKKSLMSSLKTKIGALLIQKSLKSSLKAFDAKKYGGAPLLGLKGLVVKTHGSAGEVEIKNSILQCHQFYALNINEQIRSCMEAEAEFMKKLRQEQK